MDYGVSLFAFLEILTVPLLILSTGLPALRMVRRNDPFALLETHNCPRCSESLVWVSLL